MKRVFTLDLIKYQDYHEIRDMHIRDDDVNEICTISDAPTSQSSCIDIISSDCMRLPFTFIMRCDGVAFGIIGVVRTGPTTGNLWGVGTDLIDNGGIDMVRFLGQAVDDVFNIAPILENYVDSRNTSHIRWLKFIGFTFTGLSYPHNNIPFLHFAQVRSREE